MSAESVQPSFDHIVKGDVHITSKKTHGTYKITFNSMVDFLVYQVWDENTKNNTRRSVSNQNASQGIRTFMNNNFKPTTVMETSDGKRFVFVINNAKINEKNNLVFYVSTNEIKSDTAALTNIKTGEYKNARFDIDNARNLNLIHELEFWQIEM